MHNCIFVKVYNLRIKYDFFSDKAEITVKDYKVKLLLRNSKIKNHLRIVLL